MEQIGSAEAELTQRYNALPAILPLGTALSLVQLLGPERPLPTEVVDYR